MTSNTIDELIVRMKERLGITFVIITHDIVQAVAVSDRIGMLWRGRLVAYAETAAFVRSEDPVVREFLSRNQLRA